MELAISTRYNQISGRKTRYPKLLIKLQPALEARAALYFRTAPFSLKRIRTAVWFASLLAGAAPELLVRVAQKPVLTAY